MGSRMQAEIDGWLRNGGLVITASDRAARALQAAYHQRRQEEGLNAWPAPRIQHWDSFIQSAWEERTRDARLLLNPAQEQALWANIISKDRRLATVLEGPRHRLATMAVQAHEFLCSYAPRYLNPGARTGWDADAGAFSRWLSAFDDICNQEKLLSPSRTGLEVIPLLQGDSKPRPPILAVGFDRLLLVQRRLLDAWNNWRELASSEPAPEVRFYSTSNEQSELAACARWCRLELQKNPAQRLLIITQDIARRRGEMERAFLRECNASQFEFTLGIALNQVRLTRAAHLLLRWLDGRILESDLDWLISTDLITSGTKERTTLESYMRALRDRGLARTDWNLESFTLQSIRAVSLPAAWIARMTEARKHLVQAKHRKLSPLAWVEVVPSLFDAAGWPGARQLTSAEFQAWRRWEQAVEVSGSLGIDGRRIDWPDFLSILARTLDQTVYAPESTNAPIQIAGPAQSAGIQADAIWFLSADEDAWPKAGSTHPFLPFQVQREFKMPHATHQNDWELAKANTARLLSSAPAVHFSYAKQRTQAEARPSRLIVQLAGPPEPLPEDLSASDVQPDRTVSFNDATFVPFPPNRVQGGSSVLTSQSQCPFKAFATARLAAQGWAPAEAGLTASQRGQLLHAVMHAIWGGKPHGLHSLQDLLAVADTQSFVSGHVQSVLREKVPPGVRERMPHRYLELEGRRLVHLITEWLDYEATRIPFSVAETEAQRVIHIEGLALDLRLDRIDTLIDGSPLVIDYKTGDVFPKAWELPRPEDVQLPLYAGFALDAEPGGMLFARLRAGQSKFVGQVAAADVTLFPNLKGNESLAKKKLTSGQLNAWQEYIEQLARDFVAGRADVDPRQYPATCDRCGLHAVCRIYENRMDEDADDDGGTDDE
jgi:ATP-dependent helicase/nuclease subunit B